MVSGVAGIDTNTASQWTPSAGTARREPLPQQELGWRRPELPAQPKLSTPARMMTWIVVSALCILACWAVLAANIGGLRDGFGTIGTQSGPNVEAAANLYYDLADMDGQAANVLLIGDETNLDETSSGAYKAYEKDQADANVQLEAIGSGINAIPGASTLFVSIENGLSQYSQDVSQAMYIDAQDHGQSAAQPPAAALAEYQAATALMHDTATGVLGQAQSLINKDQGTVNDTYNSAFDTIGQLRLWGTLLGLLMLIVLVVVQRKLARTFKRRVNPLLALSTVFTLIFGILLLSALGTAHSNYVVQKADAFDSVIALWQEQAVSADMNASESRWLLDFAGTSDQSAAGVADEQKLFDAEAQQVAGRATQSESGADYAHDLGSVASSVTDGETITSTGLSVGYLPTELSNVTFPGEQAAAASAFTAYATYIQDDVQLRLDAQAGGPRSVSLAAAVNFDTGQSNQDFTKYVSAVNATLQINVTAFNAATTAGQNGLGPWLWMPVVWALLMAGLIVLGFLPRLREYR
jgi:hypothetical protein